MKDKDLDIRTNQRRGRRFQQLYVDKNAPAEVLAEQYADFHGADKDKVLDVTSDVKQFLENGPLFTSFDPSEVGEKRSYKSVFTNRFRRAGISDANAKKIMHNAAADLAEKVQVEAPLADDTNFNYSNRRYGLIKRFDEKTK